jgi:hypothetical protein
MNIKEYSEKVIDYIDNLSDEEFDRLLKESGLEKYPLLTSAWTIIEDYEKSLKGFKLLWWKITCFFDNIHIWAVVKWYKLKDKLK